MKILTHKKFDKAFKKAPDSLRKNFAKQIELLKNSPTDKRLNNHVLSGKYLGCKSIDISGDWRVIYEQIDQVTIRLLVIWHP
ncbi:MAG: hypothetical protein A3C58_03380 [Candidatus Staskawiczbacteria bacterium RIFCSPHIGHO2_02_FULL_34_10]|uniref:Plasmid stabilization protein n=2 Tax=Candidatus Staskawicziibacteriota TaxID=1817916 RepID=A0A1G2HLG8_9BACT|nr:MAG: hypothetical protein A2639_02340 [Candidatus Staskawiczbacteria bacterium RIFCSPHIGHO2_01_FULL_34_27]OGZ66097.1 MAG: hypothetical protein A3C58_03380 [Candidatus Staskawiczbacteria bacterium RIFCSPHIGHO2_02_FULL_34_10]